MGRRDRHKRPATGAGTARAAWALAAAIPLVLGGQADSDALFQRARAKILEDNARLPKHTCVQTVRRSRFEAFPPVSTGRCAHVEEAAGPSALMLASSDQFKLDVTISEGAEIFSWIGAREFQSPDAQDVVGDGMTSTGDFGRFLISIFGAGGAKHEYLGLEQRQGSHVAAYLYQVPASSSRYQIKLGSKTGDLATLAYEGKFWIDPQSAGLKGLTIVVPRPPLESQTCRVETTIDYQRVQIRGSWLLLPELTLLKLWDADGSRYENRTTYGSCRAFESETVFRAELERPAGGDDPSVPPPMAGAPAPKTPGPLPRGKKLQIALRSKIDSESTFAGDAIEGQVLQAVRTRGGRILVPQGAIVRGRIVRFERHYQPFNYFVLGLKFDALAVNGGEAPLTLELAARSREEQILNSPAERRKGTGVLLFRGKHLALDHTFVSEWKTAQRNR